jgi:hypothetical protein
LVTVLTDVHARSDERWRDATDKRCMVRVSGLGRGCCAERPGAAGLPEDHTRRNARRKEMDWRWSGEAVDVEGRKEEGENEAVATEGQGAIIAQLLSAEPPI